MKKVKYILTISLVAITIMSYSQVKDTEIMMKRIFETLKNKDEEGFVKLFPDVATMRSFMQSLSNGDTANADALMGEYFERMTDSSFQKEFRDIFTRSIQKGEDKGINWAKTEWASFTADTSFEDDDGIKMASLKGRIYFNSGAKSYFIGYNDIIWFENKGWYGVSLNSIGEQNEEEDLSVGNYKDSIAVADTVAAPIDTKPVQKTKTTSEKQTRAKENKSVGP